MPCGSRSKENRVKKKVKRCVSCWKMTTTKHKHTDPYSGRKRLYPTRTSNEWTYICPAKEAMILINKLAKGGAAADLPKEVVISRAKTLCKCGCGQRTLVVQHTHEKEPA